MTATITTPVSTPRVRPPVQITEKAPTVKQLYNWAARFLELKTNNVTQPINPCIWDFDSIRSSLCRLERSIQKLNYTRNKNSHGLMAQNNRAIANINDHNDLIQSRIEEWSSYVYQYIQPQKPYISPFTIKDLFNEWRTISRIMPVVWDRTYRAPKVITNPIVLVDPKEPNIRYEFGKFSLVFPHNMINYKEVVIKAHAPRYPLGGGSNYTHPHVKLETLCFGGGNSAADVAFKSGQMFALLDTIIAILNTYGAAMGYAPFVMINRWKGICDVQFDSETGLPVPLGTVNLVQPQPEETECGNCEAPMRLMGQNVFCGCGDTVLCENCLHRCGCGATMCEVCEFFCVDCNRNVCSNCYHSDGLCNSCYGVRNDGDDEEEEEEDEEENEE